MSRDRHEGLSMRVGTYIREGADAIPHTVPRALVPNISGVHLGQRLAADQIRESQTYPYNTAYIVYPGP